MADILSPTVDDRAILERPGVTTLLSKVGGSLRTSGGGVELLDEGALRSRDIDVLLRAAVFGEDQDIRDSARWLIGEVGAAVGVVPASIHDLYIARGRGET